MKKIRSSPVIGLIVLLFPISFILGQVLVILYVKAFGFDSLEQVKAILMEDNLRSTKNIFKGISVISQLFTFLLPSVAAYKILQASTTLSFKLSLNKAPKVYTILGSISVWFFSLPIIFLSLSLNQTMIPDWATPLDNGKAEIMNSLISIGTPSELVTNLIVMALIPAICEEFCFRGLIQSYLVSKFPQPVIAIWLTAIIFSAIHFQMEGFFPRLLLGALLGYIFYWSNNLWLPILIHSVHNGIQIILAGISKEAFMTLTNTNINEFYMYFSAAIGSFFVFLLFKLRKNWLNN